MESLEESCSKADKIGMYHENSDKDCKNRAPLTVEYLNILRIHRLTSRGMLHAERKESDIVQVYRHLLFNRLGRDDDDFDVSASGVCYILFPGTKAHLKTSRP